MLTIVLHSRLVSLSIQFPAAASRGAAWMVQGTAAQDAAGVRRSDAGSPALPAIPHKSRRESAAALFSAASGRAELRALEVGPLAKCSFRRNWYRFRMRSGCVRMRRDASGF